MDTMTAVDTAARNTELRMARTLLDLYLQLQLANDQVWPLLASAADQPDHHLEALTRQNPASRTHERPPPR